MTSDRDTSGMESVKSDEGDYELWAEETVDIETPFTNVCQDDVEYLKLEIAELKQILIALAEKYKLSEDRRKVAERRNSFLKADNLRLQQISDQSLSQKIEAEIDNKRTLDKLREFIDFKHEFEKQAELLKKIISHLPKMKSVGTSTSCSMIFIEKAEQCSGDFDNNDYCVNKTKKSSMINNHSGDNNEDNIINERFGNYVELVDQEKYFNENPSKDYNEIEKKKPRVERSTDSVQNILFELSDPTDYQNVDKNCTSRDKNFENDDEEDELEYEAKVRSWDPKRIQKSQQKKDYCNRQKESVVAESISSGDMKSCKSKTGLVKLKQEILSLKNMNDWKSSDLEYKNRQLTVKNRELSQSKKEITKLKMQVNKLMIEQQKRPQSCYTSNPSYKTETSTRKTEKSKDDVTQGRIRQESKTKQSQLKTKSMTDEEKQSKSQQQISTSQPMKNDNVKLPISTESVWREIAPGDQVRIKLKKGFPEK